MFLAHSSYMEPVINICLCYFCCIIEMVHDQSPAAAYIVSEYYQNCDQSYPHCCSNDKPYPFDLIIIKGPHGRYQHIYKESRKSKENKLRDICSSEKKSEKDHKYGR